MCLEYVYTKKEKDELLNGLPEEFTVWKVLIRDGYWFTNSKYITNYQCMPVYAGETKFKTNTIVDINPDIKYRGGGHFWLYKKGAEYWKSDTSGKVVRCKIRKEWITTVGKQNGRVVVVTKKALFPKYVGERK